MQFNFFRVQQHIKSQDLPNDAGLTFICPNIEVKNPPASFWLRCGQHTESPAEIQFTKKIEYLYHIKKLAKVHHV